MALILAVLTNQRNFGDGITRAFIEALCDRPCQEVDLRQVASNVPALLSVGSIMSYLPHHPGLQVWGTGIINRHRVHGIPGTVHSVRGPLTRAHILTQGFACPEVYGDPVIVLPLVFPARSVEVRGRVGFIPHMEEANDPEVVRWREALTAQGFEVLSIDILSAHQAQEFVDAVNSCEFICSSSLHGLVVGAAYNKALLWFEMTNKVWGNGFKFCDFFMAFGMEVPSVPLRTPPHNRMAFENACVRVPPDALLRVGDMILESCPAFVNEDLRRTRRDQWAIVVAGYSASHGQAN